ncbi:MAG: ATP-binding protein [Pseudomonadota bacterium]
MLRSSLSHFFWPPVIDGDYLDAARKRCLVILCITGGLIGIASGLYDFENYYAQYPIHTLITIFSPMALFIGPVLIARAANVRTVAWLFLSYVYLGLTLVALTSGGMVSYVAFFLLPWVMLVTLFLGWKEGIGGALLVLCTYLMLYTMHGDIPPSPFDITTGSMSRWLMVGLSFALIMLTAGAATFQREMERAAVKLSEARIEAEAANRAKSDFLAKMSHEIRTPMNGVLGMAEMLESTNLDDQQTLYARTISASGTSLLSIINDILDLSKIEAGHPSFENEPFELKDFIDQIGMLFQTSAQQKQLDFLVSYNENLPVEVVGDAGRIRQILINLIGNALKFTHEGHIEIKVGGVANGSTADLEFTVEDTGIGVPADKVEHIFNKFEQVETSTTRRFEGAGLGLAISRQLAHAMGGELTMRSVQDEGCSFTFKVSLPIAQSMSHPTDTAASAPTAAVADAAPSLDGASQKTAGGAPDRIRVLIAEDNEVNRLVLKAMIDPQQYEVVFAVNGLEAVNAYKAASFDLVLMDISMPVMDGHAATREIRKFEIETDATRKPIICVTAHAFEDQREKSLANDMDDYLSKPVSKTQIDAALKKWALASAGVRQVA